MTIRLKRKFSPKKEIFAYLSDLADYFAPMVTKRDLRQRTAASRGLTLTLMSYRSMSVSKLMKDEQLITYYLSSIITNLTEICTGFKDQGIHYSGLTTDNIIYDPITDQVHFADVGQLYREHDNEVIGQDFKKLFDEINTAMGPESLSGLLSQVEIEINEDPTPVLTRLITTEIEEINRRRPVEKVDKKKRVATERKRYREEEEERKKKQKEIDDEDDESDGSPEEVSLECNENRLELSDNHPRNGAGQPIYEQLENSQPFEKVIQDAADSRGIISLPPEDMQLIPYNPIESALADLNRLKQDSRTDLVCLEFEDDDPMRYVTMLSVLFINTDNYKYCARDWCFFMVDWKVKDEVKKDQLKKLLWDIGRQGLDKMAYCPKKAKRYVKMGAFLYWLNDEEPVMKYYLDGGESQREELWARLETTKKPLKALLNK